MGSQGDCKCAEKKSMNLKVCQPSNSSNWKEWEKKNETIAKTTRMEHVRSWVISEGVKCDNSEYKKENKGTNQKKIWTNNS